MIPRVFELAAAGAFLYGGARSFLKWSRAPFEATSTVDHAWFALFIVGRVGLWLAFAGLFAIYASIGTKGRPFIDEAQRFNWFVIVLVGLAGLELIAGFALSRRSS